MITAADLSNTGNIANKLLDFLIAPSAGASATGKLELRVKNQAVATLRAYAMDLALMP